jgi:excisionase family DNA binding protein
MLNVEETSQKPVSMDRYSDEQSPEFEIVVDRDELARRLMVSPSFISKLMAEEGLPHMKIGRSTRFDVSDVRTWLKRRRKP